MRECPECGERIAADAFICRYCRAMLAAPRAPRPLPAAPRRGTPAWRILLRLFMFLTLVPLVYFLLKGGDGLEERLRKTVKENPSAASSLNSSDREDFFRTLPRNKIQGALNSRFSQVHWFYAVFASTTFWVLIMILFPLGRANPVHPWTVGLFTGTVGVFVLLALHVQFARYFRPGALDADAGLFVLMIAFTFGVALGEEFCKLLPVLWHFRRRGTLDVRGAAVWGLASGVGFGVSEGISYSTTFYNGLSTLGIYLVRFISCTALHAVWTGSAAVLVARYGDDIRAARRGGTLPGGAFLLGTGVLLHAFYNSFLAREAFVSAILVSVASFAWFFWVYESACRRELTLA